MVVKNAVLLGGAQAGKQRQHLGAAVQRLVAYVLAQVVGGLADFALAGQKDQDVARVVRVAPELVHAVGNRVVQPVFTAFFKGPVTLLHREHPPRHHDDGRGHKLWPPRFALRVVAAPQGGVALLGAARRWAARCKVLGEAVCVDGGRGDDHLQIRPARQYLAQVAQQKVDVQAALVRLVDDQRVVGLQQRVGLRLGQQNAVGHQLHRGIAPQAVLEPHLEAHHIAQRGFELFGNALGHRTGGDTARLRVADQMPTRPRMVQLAAPHGQGDLGQLRGFARAGFAADDHHLVLRNGLHDLVALGGYGQGFGELDFQHRVRLSPSTGSHVHVLHLHLTLRS